MTHEKVEILNITHFIEEFLKEESTSVGIISVFSPHTTAALILNEDEAGLKEDILKLSDVITQHVGTFLHNRVDHNASAHLTQIMYGHHVFVPFGSGKLLLGDWQSILFLEFDGPRQRRIVLTGIKEELVDLTRSSVSESDQSELLQSLADQRDRTLQDIADIESKLSNKHHLPLADKRQCEERAWKLRQKLDDIKQKMKVISKTTRKI